MHACFNVNENTDDQGRIQMKIQLKMLKTEEDRRKSYN
jgi:hypothetical protein